MEKQIAHAQASVIKCRSTVVKILWRVEREVRDIVSGQSVHDDGLLDAGNVSSFPGVLLFSWINAATNSNISAVPVSNRKPRTRRALKRAPRYRVSALQSVARH